MKKLLIQYQHSRMIVVELQWWYETQPESWEKTNSTSYGFVLIEVGDVRVYSCYFSPNDIFWKFEEELEALEDSISGQFNQRVLITGDLN